MEPAYLNDAENQKMEDVVTSIGLKVLPLAGQEHIINEPMTTAIRYVLEEKAEHIILAYKTDENVACDAALPASSFSGGDAQCFHVLAVAPLTLDAKAVGDMMMMMLHLLFSVAFYLYLSDFYFFLFLNYLYESYELPHAMLRLDRAGRDPAEYVMTKTVTERGYSPTRTAEPDIVHNVKEETCYIAVDSDIEMNKTADSSDLEKSYKSQTVAISP